MTFLPTNEQFLQQIKDLNAEMLSDSSGILPDDLPQDLVDWLTQLALLYGVPFDNLVPNPALLPMESIRFFYVDQNWVNSILDGALSIGIQTSRDLAIQIQKSESTKAKAKQSSSVLRKKALKQTNLDATDPTIPMAGMLLRSEVVSGWPGLEVMAYSDTVYPPQNLIATLRMERLSPDVLLCLFAEVPKQVIVAEPKEGLRFGLIPGQTAGEYLIQPRFLGGSTAHPTGKPSANEPSEYAQAQFRNDKQVIDVLKTINKSGVGLKAVLDATGVELPATGFHAAAFAVEMIFTAENATFTLDESSLCEPDVGCPPSCTSK